jgi:hypothetical protein
MAAQAVITKIERRAMQPGIWNIQRRVVERSGSASANLTGAR